MYELSQEEKEKIRAEMEYREIVSRELACPKGWFTRAWLAASHPIIITILGGVLLACIGALLTHVQQLQGKKYELLSKFSEEMDREVTLVYNIKLISLKVRGKAEDPMKRTRTEFLSLFSELSGEYSKGARGKAALFAVKALFKADDIRDKADKLYDDLLQTDSNIYESREPLEKDITRIQMEIKELAAAMGKEIREFTCKGLFLTI